jgi:hypothetical protein
MLETKSSVKYGAHYGEFTGKGIRGVVIDLVNTGPDHRIILNNLLHTGVQSSSLSFPTADQYTLFDIWYELYKNNRRDITEFSSDLNPFHWHNEWNKISYDYPHSLHMNSFTVGTWLEKEYDSDLKSVIGTVSQVIRNSDGSIQHLILDDGRKIQGDFFLDCSGLTRLLGNACDVKWNPVNTIAGHNSALISSNYYKNVDELKKRLTPYTDIVGRDWGWMFRIPTLTKESYGYVFNSEQTNSDKIIKEFDESSDPSTRLMNPFVIKWNPGYYETPMMCNFAMIGLSSLFIDPFDANSIFSQVRQINMLVRYFNGDINDSLRTLSFSNSYNDDVKGNADALTDRIEFTFAGAPRNTSEYWQRYHDMNLRDSIEKKLVEGLSNNIHSPASMLNGSFKPWPMHIYFMFGLYYGVDFSQRLRQSNPKMLNLADSYFTNTSEFNKKIAEYCPSIDEWLEANGVDINSLLNQGLPIPRS